MYTEFVAVCTSNNANGSEYFPVYLGTMVIVISSYEPSISWSDAAHTTLLTCSKNCGFLFINCMQLQGFPIDSRTFARVKRIRVSYRGGGPWKFPPPSEILKLSMVIVLSQVLNNNLVPDCVRSNLRGSKFKIFPGGGHAPRPP